MVEVEVERILHTLDPIRTFWFACFQTAFSLCPSLLYFSFPCFAFFLSFLIISGCLFSSTSFPLFFFNYSVFSSNYSISDCLVIIPCSYVFKKQTNHLDVQNKKIYHSTQCCSLCHCRTYFR